MSRSSKWVVSVLLVSLLVLAIIVLTLSHSTPGIVGKWVRQSENACGVTYPSGLEFFDDKNYVTTGPSLWWNGGPYGVVSSSRIRIETFTGPTMYDFVLRGERLTFTNSLGCTIVYTRMADK